VGSAAANTGQKALLWAVDPPPAALTTTAAEARLRQVLANLLENAVRHSPTDGVVTISARRAGERIFIDVHDEGGGIPKEDRRRICARDRKSTRLNSSHVSISYAVFCLKKKKSQ